jgi:hypothetical protein
MRPEPGNNRHSPSRAGSPYGRGPFPLSSALDRICVAWGGPHRRRTDDLALALFGSALKGSFDGCTFGRARRRAFDRRSVS